MNRYDGTEKAGWIYCDVHKENKKNPLCLDEMSLYQHHYRRFVEFQFSSFVLRINSRIVELIVLSALLQIRFFFSTDARY